MNDPRKAKTLDEACANGDGSYNGARALAWLSEALFPGKGVSEEEVRTLWEETKAKLSGPAAHHGHAFEMEALHHEARQTGATRDFPDGR